MQVKRMLMAAATALSLAVAQNANITTITTTSEQCGTAVATTPMSSVSTVTITSGGTATSSINTTSVVQTVFPYTPTVVAEVIAVSFQVVSSADPAFNSVSTKTVYSTFVVAASITPTSLYTVAAAVYTTITSTSTRSISPPANFLGVSSGNGIPPSTTSTSSMNSTMSTSMSYSNSSMVLPTLRAEHQLAAHLPGGERGAGHALAAVGVYPQEVYCTVTPYDVVASSATVTAFTSISLAAPSTSTSTSSVIITTTSYSAPVGQSYSSTLSTTTSTTFTTTPVASISTTTQGTYTVSEYASTNTYMQCASYQTLGPAPLDSSWGQFQGNTFIDFTFDLPGEGSQVLAQSLANSTYTCCVVCAQDSNCAFAVFDTKVNQCNIFRAEAADATSLSTVCSNGQSSNTATGYPNPPGNSSLAGPYVLMNGACGSVAVSNSTF